MRKRDLIGGRELLAAILVAMIVLGSAVAGPRLAWAGGGACALVPNECLAELCSRPFMHEQMHIDIHQPQITLEILVRNKELRHQRPPT